MDIETIAQYRQENRTPLNPGDIIYQWDTGNEGFYGVGYYPSGVWFIDNVSHALYVYAAVENPDFVLIGFVDFGAETYGDMAYDEDEDEMWVVNIGGDNPLTLFDMASGQMTSQLTGSWGEINPRGLAYDSDNNYLWVGGDSQYGIYCIDKYTGDIVTTIPAPGDVAGLAWNCSEETLWMTANGATDYIYELNPQTGEILTTLDFPDSDGFDSGGCEMDENGDLWVYNWQNHNAYLIETDAGGCYYSWLSVEPNTATIPGGEVDTFMVRANNDDWLAGVYYGTVSINHNDIDVESPLDLPVIVNFPPMLVYGDAGPEILDIQLSEGSSDPIVEQLWITSSEGSQALMAWEILPDEGGLPDWLELSEVEGSGLYPGDTTFVDVTFDPSELAPGIYSTVLTTHWYGPEDGNEDWINHYVSFNINNPDISIQPENGFVGENVFYIPPGDSIAEKTLSIMNTGNGPLICNLTTTTMERARSKNNAPSKVLSKNNSDRNWLSLSDGYVEVGSGETAEVIVTVDITGFESGDFWGEIGIIHNDPDVESPLIVPVYVTPICEFYSLAISHTELYMGYYDYNPNDDWHESTITLTNAGTEGGQWTANWQEDWMIVQPDSGWIDAAESVELSILLNVGNGLLGGLHEDDITIEGGGQNDPTCLVWFELTSPCILPPDIFEAQWEPYPQQVHVSWGWEDYIPDDVGGYQLFRKLNDDLWGEIPYWITDDPNILDFYDDDVPPCDSLHYAIKAVASWSQIAGFFSNPVTLMGYTDIKDYPITNSPEKFSLSQNYPNPFNPETEIFYSIPNSSRVTLEIYTVNGQLVRFLVDEDQAANFYSVLWDGKDGEGKAMPGGVYIYTLSAGDYYQSKRMILLK